MNPAEPEELDEKEGTDVVMTVENIAVLFYTLVKQNQQQRPGSKMCFDLKKLKNLPQIMDLVFEKKGSKLFVWIAEKQKDRKKKSRLFLPGHQIVRPN